MTEPHNAPAKRDLTLAERVAPMTIDEIDAMSDQEVAELLGATADEIDAAAQMRRRLGGRPRVGGAGGEGPSMQVRVRVTTETRTALETIAAAQGRRLADVSRDALDEYVARHAS